MFIVLLQRWSLNHSQARKQLFKEYIYVRGERIILRLNSAVYIYNIQVTQRNVVYAVSVTAVPLLRSYNVCNLILAFRLDLRESVVPFGSSKSRLKMSQYRKFLAIISRKVYENDWEANT